MLDVKLIKKGRNTFMNTKNTKMLLCHLKHLKKERISTDKY